MSKEKLHEIITESFVNDKIDMDKFLKLSEKVDNISENKAEEILTELNLNIFKAIKDIELKIANQKQILANAKGEESIKKIATRKINFLEKHLKRLKMKGKIGVGLAAGAAVAGGAAYALKKKNAKINK